jgi:hypothetical protein
MAQIQIPLPHLLNQIQVNRNKVVQGWNTNNQHEVRSGVEGLALLIGKCLTQISSNEENQFASQALSVLLDAQDVINATTEPEEMFFVNTDKPSQWVSFDGEIKYPLYKSTSQIPNAGNGLFCERDIKRGECIGPSRVKVDDSGDFFKDWNKFPMATMVNHHPIPNVSIVRGKPPLGSNDMFIETCYFVANRDIPANTELVSDYRDTGWAEWDYYDDIPLPFEQWDRNCMQQYGGGQSITEMISQHAADYSKSVGMVGGPALLYASTKNDGLLSNAMALGGLLLTGFSTVKNMK